MVKAIIWVATCALQLVHNEGFYKQLMFEVINLFYG